MARVRLLPQYRGLRIYPYMRHMSAILFSILFIVGLAPIGYYSWTIRDSLQMMDRPSIYLVSGLLLFVLFLSLYLTWYLQVATVFFAKWDRLKRLARFLYEHNYVYQKKGSQGKNSVSFPRVYLKQNKFDLEVAFELAGSKFQQKFKKIGGELEDTFAMDFMESEDDDRFKTYRLAYSAILNRIKISDVDFSYEKGVRLMKNFFWDFLSDPHLLLAGGTGGGKTVFLRALIRCLAAIGVVDIADPKRADFVTMADIPAFKGRVAFETEDIVNLFEKAERTMYARYDFMRAEMERLGHTDLKRFYEYGLEPYFLVCDEYNSFVNSLDYKQRERVERALIKLTLLGRQAGVNVILAMQKPTSEDVPTKVRDNMNMRIVVGRLSDTGYTMMFGDENATKSFKFMKWVGGMRVFGRGYAAVNGEVAREFYAPLLEKGFSFHDAFSALERKQNPFDPAENQTEPAPDEEESESDGLEEELIDKTVSVFAKEIGKSAKQVRTLIALLESEEKWTFTKNSENKYVLGEDEVLLLSTLFAKKEDFEGTWKELVVEHFKVESI